MPSSDRANASPGFMMSVRLFIATMAGVGKISFASGTWGTLATIPIYLALAWAGSIPIYIGGMAAIILLSVWACGAAETTFGRKDPGEAVADEMCGYLVTMAFVPVPASGAGLALTVFMGFLFFRFTDIVKPFPARRFEKLPGGLGIVADDVMAGVWSNLMMQAAIIGIARLGYGSLLEPARAAVAGIAQR
jgi:phosphatidylglycerophosphatase A